MARTRSNNKQTPKQARRGRKTKQSPLIKDPKILACMVRRQRKEYNPDLVKRIKENLEKWKKDELFKSVMCLLGDTSLTYSIEDIQQDLNLFQDLDLAVFGAPNEIYQEYTDQLQKEYSHMDINSYKKMRLKILQTFLTIPYIYTTEKFRNKYEEIARSNIKNEISELQK